MKRFRFTLQSLRRYKKQQKQQLENQFAVLCRELTLQQQQLDGLLEDLRQSTARGMENADPISVRERLAASEYAGRIRKLIACKQLQVQELRTDCERLREQFLAASKEVETLETLHAQQHAEHESIRSRQNQQELNDHLANSWFNAEMEDTR